ncbi:aprataxin and PNK-like factor isoform X2 [Sorex fumeus]|uniref:aprataxin and PNK-like factor isoform X2 n=1 Tax=Sorex fumeus TaxID=62283 RepID=UPI0024ADAC0C|nr:aprataxin and PNK-like factor isoform X2 [Sorex fumeus]
MSGGFELQPRDGGPRLALAPGETVIGRGPLLGITDKRVSRRHAILEVVGGQLRIKPIHTNPCFYQSSEKSQFLPLRTNVWRWLNPGDSFSLLLDKYAFCVCSTHSETEMECTLRNSQMLDEDDILNETPESSLMNLPNDAAGTLQQERNLEIAKTRTTTANSTSSLGECRNFSEQKSNPIQRKRILPAWMLTGSLSEQNLSAPDVSGDNDVIQENGKKAIYKDKTQRNKTQQGRKRLVSSENSKSTSSEEDTKKKCRNADEEESPVISTKEIQPLSPVTLSDSEENHIKTETQRNKIPTDKFDQISEHTVSEEMPDKEDRAADCSKSSLSAQDNTPGSHPESGSHPSSPETSPTEAADSDPQGSEENKVKRTSCMYGANCYRKNPVHFQHFSHPGDNDYGSLPVMDQDEADDRPECPYGASCYRKNPQHKIEYRHDALPKAAGLEVPYQLLTENTAEF